MPNDPTSSEPESVTVGDAAEEHFYLRSSVLAASKSLPIKKDMFDEIAGAHNFYSDVILIEEKYDTVVENYYEFERELIEIAARHMLFDISDESFFNQTSLINRRLLNLLAAVRMYNDHTKRQIIRLFGRKSSLLKAVLKKSDQIKQSNAGYFFLDHIRNFLQHAGYALDGFSVGSSSRHVDGNFISFHDLRAKFSMAEILDDPRTDKSIRERMPEIENMDAKDLIRSGIDGVSEFHQHLRDNIDEHLASRKDIIVSALSLFEACELNSTNESPVLVREVNHKPVFHRHISHAILRRFESYRKKNRQLRRLSSQRIIS
ncbi:hypothetical protein ABS771_18675 [Methylobacterium brachiatum]|uniref:Uncharacterized protein n=1 Tax=Methylobacterium brachiatum TaxID=269660 RepID=A0ABV1R5L0_9HYPH